MASARFGCVDGRAVLITDSLTSYVDIEKFSSGRSGSVVESRGSGDVAGPGRGEDNAHAYVGYPV